jgi:sulfate permease, SulP family
MALTVSAGLSGITGDTRIEALFVMTFLVGAFQLLAGLLRLGRLTRFVSNTVMVGFFTGVGVLIVLGQLSNLTGYQSSGSNKITQTFDLFMHLNLADPATVSIGIVTLAIIVIARHTQIRNFAAILAIVVSTVLVQLFGLSSVASVSSIGAITASLPLPQLPNLLLSPMIITAALSAAVIGLIQGAGVSSNFPNPDGTYADISRDFVGQGVGNLVAGLFRGMPIGGSISQTAVMLAAGAKTRMANIFCAVFLVVIVLVFGS